MEPDDRKPEQGRGNVFAARNDVVRVDAVDSLDEHLSSSLRTFFRVLGVPHLYGEQIAPAVQTDSARVFVAVRDRPWPPWGLGGRKIAAICQVQPIGEALYGLGPIYVTDEDATNVGLVGALLKEALEVAAQEENAEVSYLVLDGSVLGGRVLELSGFVKTDDAVVTDAARYSFYRAPAQKVLDELGLAKTSAPELLAHQLDDETFKRLALFYAVLYVAGHPREVDHLVVREIIPILGGLFGASLPGGVPPTPPTALPAEIPRRGPIEDTR